MAKRVHMSTSDYVVLAITPALLIVMISSLASYLIACFYGGEHDFRLKLISFLFSMGSVLCCRIAVEEGKEYAMSYAFALGFVVFLAAQKFVQLGLLLNLGLVVTIMWTAWKLTWDSTVIDDTEGSSGEGLLETIRQEQEGDSDDSDEPDESDESDEPDELAAEAVTGESPSPESETPFWKKWLASKRRPHNPGRWIIYYAVGSVPLLALGNMVVPPSGRGPAFRALGLYVASALAVLLSTSFLGLRKYLRQRRLEMPMDMAAVWLGSGAVLIALVMAASLLLPRPGVELAADRAWQFGAERLSQASNYGQGSDAADSSEGRAGKTEPSPSAKQSGGKQSGGKQSGGKQSGGKQSGGKQSGGKQSGGKPSGGKQSGGKQSGGKQSGGKQSGGKQSGGKQSGGKQSGGKQSGGKQSGGKQSGGKQSGGKQSGGKQSGGKQSGGKQSGGKQSGGKQSPQETSGKAAGSSKERSSDSEREPAGAKSNANPEPPRSTPPRDEQAESRGMQVAQNEASQQDSDKQRDNAKSDSSSTSRSNPSRWRSPLSWLPSLGVRVIYWLGLILIVGYLLVRYRKEVQAALRQFVADLRRLWARLFGSRASGEATLESQAIAIAPSVRQAGFGDFQNPFRTGQWQRESAESLVRYTFAAAEAWARDHQCDREPEQTAQEFARQLAVQHPQLQQSSAVLAQLYNHAAYAPRSLPAQNIEHLKNVWATLESAAQQTTSPPPPAASG